VPGASEQCSNDLRVTQTAKTDTTFTRVYTGEINTAGTGAGPADLRLFAQAVTGTGLVSSRTNESALFQVLHETATLASPKMATSLLLKPLDRPPTFGAQVRVSAILSDSFGKPIGNKPVTLTLGGARAERRTDPDTGEATALLPANAPPGYPHGMTAAFAEDVGYLESAEEQRISIERARTELRSCAVPCDLSLSHVVASLFADPGRAWEHPLNEQLITIELGDCGRRATQSDARGRVLVFDPLDCLGGGTVRLTYGGDERYLPSSLCFTAGLGATDCPPLAGHSILSLDAIQR
jgi:hypothetical protein